MSGIHSRVGNLEAKLGFPQKLSDEVRQKLSTELPEVRECVREIAAGEKEIVGRLGRVVDGLLREPADRPEIARTEAAHVKRAYELLGREPGGNPISNSVGLFLKLIEAVWNED